MALVEKHPDGTLVRLSVDDLDRAGSVEPAALEGASAGFLNENDIDLALSMIEPGSSGGILVYEKLWAAPATAALRRGGGRLVAGGGRVGVQAVRAALDVIESRG